MLVPDSDIYQYHTLILKKSLGPFSRKKKTSGETFQISSKKSCPRSQNILRVKIQKFQERVIWPIQDCFEKIRAMCYVYWKIFKGGFFGNPLMSDEL